MKKLTAIILALAMLFAFAACGGTYGEEDSLGDTANTSNPAVNEPSVFSYAEDSAMFVEGEPGVKTSGFVNTSETEITFENVAEHAMKECTIEYNQVSISLDAEACIWRVDFSTSGMAGGCLSVYMNYKGITVLIVQGE